MFFLILLALMAIFAFVGFKMAESRGKDPVLWAILCGLTGLIGLLFLAASGQAKREPDTTKPYEPAQIPPPSSSGETSPPKTATYDEKKWAILKEVDPEVRAAAQEIAALGPAYEADMAEKYQVLNDKTYLAPIVAAVKERAAQVAEDIKRIESSRSEKAAAYYAEYMGAVHRNRGLDPRTSKKVARVEEFYGDRAVGWHGGITVYFEDGTVEIREGNKYRPFDSQAEAEAWGGKPIQS